MTEGLEPGVARAPGVVGERLSFGRCATGGAIQPPGVRAQPAGAAQPDVSAA